MASYYTDKPMPLLTSNMAGQWHISQQAISTLEAIDIPVAVIAIIGKYRTGKSYLMNRIAGCNSGFEIGPNVQMQTKGIWMWAKPHPQNPNHCLILLDTEGLQNVELGDQKHDIELFILAVLLSNCLLMNSVGTIDDHFVKQIQLVAELSDKIRVTKNASLDDAIRSEHFRSVFPSLFVVLRDFYFDLIIDGKQVTEAEYLENALKIRPGFSMIDQQYNAPRECVRQYFPKRACFTLPQPISDAALLRDLEKFSDDNLRKDFTIKFNALLQAVLSDAKPIHVKGDLVRGSGLAVMLREYVHAINVGAVPCIESTLEVLIETECRKALDVAFTAYKAEMANNIRADTPLENNVLDNLHSRIHTQTVQLFNQKAFVKHGECYSKYLQELERKLHAELQTFKSQNTNISIAKSNEAKEVCFKLLENDIQQNSFVKIGGHAMYIKVRDAAVVQYKAMTALGPMKEHVLQEYLANKQATEQIIHHADQELTAKENEAARLREQARREEEERLAVIRRQEEYKNKLSTKYFAFLSHLNGFAMDVRHGNMRAGERVITWPYSPGATNQHWICDHATQTIRSMANRNFCLDICGDRLAINPYSGSINQKWVIDGDRVHRADNRNLVLDIHHCKSGKGIPIRPYAYNGGPNQHWKLNFI